MDGQDKPRSFGFAIFEDAESTNTAFRMLEDFAIPAIHSNKKPTKLSVFILDNLMLILFFRYELMRVQWIISPH